MSGAPPGMDVDGMDADLAEAIRMSLAAGGGGAPAETRWMYHERQSAALCGQHCLNNLLQGSHVTAGGLAEIAHELDEKERALMLAEGVDTPEAIRFLASDSHNVDESGNFSVSVLTEELRRRFKLYLSTEKADVDGAMKDPSKYNAFVLNLDNHWFTIRNLHGTWWNLNSLFSRPSPISEMYLAMFLAQLVAEGYSLFVVQGDIPLPSAAAAAAGDPRRWFDADAVRAMPPSEVEYNKAVAAAQAKVVAREKLSGMGGSEADLRRAIAASLAGGGGGADAAAPPPAEGGGKSAEEEELRIAIAMSMSIPMVQSPMVGADGGGEAAAGDGGFDADLDAALRRSVGGR